MAKLTSFDRFKNLDEKLKNKKNKVVKTVSEADTKKRSLMISAKVNVVQYDKFKKINEAKGVSNNAILNELIARYIQKNSAYLEN